MHRMAIKISPLSNGDYLATSLLRNQHRKNNIFAIDPVGVIVYSVRCWRMLIIILTNGAEYEKIIPVHSVVLNATKVESYILRRF